MHLIAYAGMMFRDLSHGAEPIRLDSLEIGTREQYAWLLGIVKAVLVLNLLDAVLTLWWVTNGLAVEANTLLRDLVVENPLQFVLAKIGLVSLGSVFLWRLRYRPLAVIAIFGAFFVYYLVLLHHIRYWSASTELTMALQGVHLMVLPMPLLAWHPRSPGDTSRADLSEPAS